MILALLMDMTESFLNVLGRFLPNWSLPDLLTEGVVTVLYYIKALDPLFPVNHLITVSFIIFSYYSLFAVYKFVGNLISLIRGGGKI